MTIWLIAILPMLLLGLWGSIFERREWNGGICRENGLPWKYFDTDSQGGRGYKAGDRYCWISYPGIDTKQEG